MNEMVEFYIEDKNLFILHKHILPADDLVTQRAKASAAMVWHFYLRYGGFNTRHPIQYEDVLPVWEIRLWR